MLPDYDLPAVQINRKIRIEGDTAAARYFQSERLFVNETNPVAAHQIHDDGFGFAPVGDTYKKIPQIGNVILEDDVEIGANTCVDCATMGSTIIHKGVKLDNLVQIAHNVTVGENTVIAAATA